MGRSMVILYVPDQQAARDFWRALLQAPPTLDVPGMTEFELPGGLLLGLMPEAGIRRLLPALSAEIARGPRSELYLAVEDPAAWLARALAAGATLMDGPRPRSWGDTVAYCLDPWGHVLGFSTD
jgi:catechol 2,3-dioxygenase-like lactoylglutathione lyase family enzyme